MNLLYISNNSNSVDGGLNWSVPASVKAQEKYDKVLWVDLTLGAFQEHWGKVEAYHNLKDFGRKICLDILPQPFNNPDCVIFEGFYFMAHIHLAKELVRKRIPYIIVPRGSLTARSFHNGGIFKYIKKKLAFSLIFNNYIESALSVQYLTEDESFESHKNFSKSSFILPNGFSTPPNYKQRFSNGIKAVFIGRQDINQKGLDLLLKAIKALSTELKSVDFRLDIYGPKRYDYQKVSSLIEEFDIGDIVCNHERGISGNEKQNVLLSSDVFFLTSRFEGHPMALIEALAYGLPSFITRGANMYDEINHYKAGWACETSVQSIIENLKQMISDKESFIDLSHNARKLSLNYDWDILAQKMHNELLFLLNKTE